MLQVSGGGFAAITVLRQQCLCLIEFVLGGMVLKFCCTHCAIRHAQGEFGAFQRLLGIDAALDKGARADQIIVGLIELRTRSLHVGSRALYSGLRSAQSFLGLTPAPRIEKWRGGRGYDRNDVVGSDAVAGLEPNATQTARKRRGHHIPLADVRLAILINRGDEAALSNRRCFDRYGAWYQGPHNSSRRRQKDKAGNNATNRDAHGQSLVLRTATRSRRSMRLRTTKALAIAVAITTMVAAK